jgi:hypothetical protein
LFLMRADETLGRMNSRSLEMDVFRHCGFMTIALAGLCWLAEPAGAQQPLDQQLDFGDLSDGAFADPPDLPDGDIENLDQFNGYPAPERAEALPPPDRLYIGPSSANARHRRRPR